MKLGADPELFFVDHTNNLVSSIGRLGGTKEHPLRIRADGCAIQEDNVAVEFNIPPSESKDAFIEAINFNLRHLEAKAAEMGLTLAIQASAVFPDSELDHPAAREFGCEPDYNAYTRDVNPKPCASNGNLRSAGGHIHISYDGDKYKLIRACDISLGLWSVLVDSDTARRELYGKAGAFRPKPYGAEYRTLSNFWIKNKALIGEAWDRTGLAIKLADTMEDAQMDEVAGAIQHAINHSDRELAKQMMQALKVA